MQRQTRFDEDGEPEQKCSRCHEWLPADNEFFPKNGDAGLGTWCKVCHSEYSHDRYYRMKRPALERVGSPGIVA